eukprot:7839788-Lingulodinium_polyedra.AAC.1
MPPVHAGGSRSQAWEGAQRVEWEEGAGAQRALGALEWRTPGLREMAKNVDEKQQVPEEVKKEETVEQTATALWQLAACAG